LLSFLLLQDISSALSWPVAFTDSLGHEITISRKPARVVSVVPGLTEIIFTIGAGDAVRGVTHYDTWPPETSKAEIVGGFFAPSAEKIRELKPDILLVSSIQKKLIAEFENTDCRIICMENHTLSDNYTNILLLGKIFGRADQALDLINRIKKDIELISEKNAAIPASERQRVMRLMGRDSVMTPGDDSFQNEYIRLAGGIPPKLGKNGSVVPVTKEEWTAFNPQVIYGCGGDRQVVDNLLNRPGWKDVDAVKNGRILFFPCELTCRASARSGYFVSNLAAHIYSEQFGKPENQVIEDQIVKSVPVPLNLDYVKKSRVVHTSIFDFIHKNLLVEFKIPMTVVSTLEGQRQNIRFVGNSYSPPQVWDIYHRTGLNASRDKAYKTLKIEGKETAFLFTGADMDNLTVTSRKFKNMEVTALVTAGVETNAVRMSQDSGDFYEPGTINMILMANMKLSARAMTRAIISATEAKTAALNDMDIRSSYTPLTNPATGTGTDNIIVVEGSGTPLDNAGGHSKLGELIARAVYEGVQKAVYRQNALTQKRNIFERLRERKIELSGLIVGCECAVDKGELTRSLEYLLMNDRYAGFLEAAFGISDLYGRGLVQDLGAFRLWCTQVRDEIAGQSLEARQPSDAGDGSLPEPVSLALGAMLDGLRFRAEE